MTKATVYTTALCPYCTMALSLLRKKKGVEIEEIRAGFSPKKRKEMMARSNGGYTFPQIFIGETHVGGCDDMMALERAGKLDALLANGG
ncbi:MAG: glutaredoxin 3 [Robiginitomaculum sp.]|nr:MAG: glutaredoxin 3 [Robiginitomaculum sp.]